MENKKEKNPWTTQDEGHHYPIGLEWWCTEGIFKTIENNKNYSFKAVLSIGSADYEDYCYFLTVFDIEKNRYYTYRVYSKSDDFKFTKNRVDVGYEGSYIKGKYPNYSMLLHDKNNDIILDLKFEAETLPHWIAQEITDGMLPMGLGFYRYGFLPKCKLTGSIKIENKTLKAQGFGYVEHIWGNWSYSNPLTQIRQLKKTIPTYLKLGKWWFSKNKIKIPDTISFTNENNPFGYDWAWAVFDNGWSLFYGNIMFWIMQGPALGVLYITPDTKTYWKFGKIRFKYNQIRFSKNYDFCYPSDFEITAEEGRKSLRLRFKMETDTYEHVKKLNGKIWSAFVICESVGVVEGYYCGGEKKTMLNGKCRIESQRQVSVFGHNKIRFDFIKPPKGFGFNAELDSHFLKRNIKTKIHLLPKFSIKLKVKTQK